jgi:prepilin-type N-terminal cleavage/methylation domain-containing protein
MRAPSAHGFTLIEVLVAVTLAGIVVVAAHQIFTGVADGARAVAGARQSLDHSSNARRWLKVTFLSLQPPFEGQSDRLSFMSWQLTSGGWFEQEPTELVLDRSRVVVRAGNITFPLVDNVTALSFDYLLEPGAESRWVREWISPLSAPLAIRVRVAGCGRGDAGCVDTLLFLIKERG